MLNPVPTGPAPADAVQDQPKQTLDLAYVGPIDLCPPHARSNMLSGCCRTVPAPGPTRHVVLAPAQLEWVPHATRIPD